MRALRITGPRRIELATVEDPRPRAGEVVVSIEAGGVCGTDLHIYRGEMPPLPRVPGHDVAGRIVKVGKRVAQSRVGERVVVDPAACCLRDRTRSQGLARDQVCPRCSEGRTHLCRQGAYLGIHEDGAFCQRIVVPALRAVTLPDGISLETVTTLEPVVVALHLLERIKDRPGRCVVLGGGPIGLVAAKLLSEQRSVLLVEPREGRRSWAQRWGLEAVDPSASMGQRPVDGFELVIEASGHAEAAQSCLELAGLGSTVVLIGGPTEIPGLAILTRELEVRAVKGGRGLYPEAIRAVLDGRVEPGDLVDRVVDWRDAPQLFSDLCGTRPGMRAMLTFESAAD